MCLLNYGNSCQVAEDNLGPSHRLTRKFRILFTEFNAKLTKAEKTSIRNINVVSNESKL